MYLLLRIRRPLPGVVSLVGETFECKGMFAYAKSVQIRSESSRSKFAERFENLSARDTTVEPLDNRKPVHGHAKATTVTVQADMCRRDGFMYVLVHGVGWSSVHEGRCQRRSRKTVGGANVLIQRDPQWQITRCRVGQSSDCD